MMVLVVDGIDYAPNLWYTTSWSSLRPFQSGLCLRVGTCVEPAPRVSPLLKRASLRVDSQLPPGPPKVRKSIANNFQDELNMFLESGHKHLLHLRDSLCAMQLYQGSVPPFEVSGSKGRTMRATVVGLYEGWTQDST